MKRTDILILATIISYSLIQTGDGGDQGFQFSMFLSLLLGAANGLNTFIILPVIGLILLVICIFIKRKDILYFLSLLLLYPDIVILARDYMGTSLQVRPIYYYSLIPFFCISAGGMIYFILQRRKGRQI